MLVVNRIHLLNLLNPAGLRSLIWAIVFYASALFALFPAVPTKFTGWIACILILPVFSVVVAKLMPDLLMNISNPEKLFMYYF